MGLIRKVDFSCFSLHRLLMLHRALDQGYRQRVRAPVKKFFRPPSKGGLPKNLYPKSERPTLGCRVTWAWRERVNSGNRQIMILQRNLKTYAAWWGPGNLHRLSPNLSSAMFRLWIEADFLSKFLPYQNHKWSRSAGEDTRVLAC